MLTNIETAAAPEKDILLVGDFNLPPSSCPWASAGKYQALIQPPLGTTVSNKLYDNIWIAANRRVSSEYTGECGVLKVDEEFYPNTKNYAYAHELAKDARKTCS